MKINLKKTFLLLSAAFACVSCGSDSSPQAQVEEEATGDNDQIPLKNLAKGVSLLPFVPGSDSAQSPLTPGDNAEIQKVNSGAYQLSYASQLQKKHKVKIKLKVKVDASRFLENNKGFKKTTAQSEDKKTTFDLTKDDDRQKWLESKKYFQTKGGALVLFASKDKNIPLNVTVTLSRNKDEKEVLTYKLVLNKGSLETRKNAFLPFATQLEKLQKDSSALSAHQVKIKDMMTRVLMLYNAGPKALPITIP